MRVLVVTRHVAGPVNGIGYFVLVAGVVLLAGVVVAAALARRISAPIVRAVSATRQIAGGNLAATVPVDGRDYPELAELAEAINTLGENLSRAQGLEREFLLSVSHELRTPLTSIRGYADAITDGATDDVPGAVHIIGSEARRLERLVQDLLDLARLQARQFSLHTQRVDCGAVARTVAEGFQPEAAAIGVALVVERRRGGPVGRRRSRPRGPGRRQPHRERPEVRHHHGRGRHAATGRMGGGVGRPTTVRAISAADLPHIFERHYRSDRVPGRKLGVGLGLAIVAELASAMGGVVDAQSPLDDGRGARMVLWLHAAAPARGPRGSRRCHRVSGDADAGAPPPPPCVGGAPLASAPVAALRLPTVEPQSRRSSGLRIGRLGTGRHGPDAAVRRRRRLQALVGHRCGGAARAGGARCSTRRSRLRGRSTRARTTEPRYRTMNPITATSHRSGPDPSRPAAP